MKKLVLSSLEYTVVAFVLAMLWHVVLFKKYYVSTGMLEEPKPLFGLASIIIQALILPALYSAYHKGVRPAAEGLGFGLLLAALLGSFGVVEAASRYDLGPLPRWFAYEGSFFVALYVLTGLAFGMIFGRPRRAAG